MCEDNNTGQHGQHDHHHHDHGAKTKSKPVAKRGNFLTRAFSRARHIASDNKTPLKVALTSGLLLGTTALATPFISTTLGACTILGGSLYLLAKAGDLSVDSAETAAEKMKISPLMVGLAAGAMASVPEFLVALQSVFHGAQDIGIGQLVGANIAHVFLILGATAVAGKGIVQGRGMGWKFNTAAMAGTTALFGGLLATNMLTLPVGIGMVGLTAAYLGANYLINKRDAATLKVDPKSLFHSHGPGDDHGHDHNHNRPGWVSALLGAGSVGALALGADMAIKSGSALALNASVDPSVIGTLGVALGVSLPELIFSVKAARRGHTQMAVGNILGCNIFNILAVGSVLALSNTPVPASFGPNSTLGLFNLAALGTSAGLMTATMMANKGGVKRWQGALALMMYMGYVGTNLSLGGYNHDAHLQANKPAVTATTDQSAQAPKLPKKISHRFL